MSRFPPPLLPREAQRRRGALSSSHRCSISGVTVKESVNLSPLHAPNPTSSQPLITSLTASVLLSCSSASMRHPGRYAGQETPRQSQRYLPEPTEFFALFTRSPCPGVCAALLSPENGTIVASPPGRGVPVMSAVATAALPAGETSPQPLRTGSALNCSTGVCCNACILPTSAPTVSSGGGRSDPFRYVGEAFEQQLDQNSSPVDSDDERVDDTGWHGSVYRTECSRGA